MRCVQALRVHAASPLLCRAREKGGMNATAMDDVSHSDDATWLLTAAAFILTMQTGFALLETGYSTKNNEV